MHVHTCSGTHNTRTYLPMDTYLLRAQSGWICISNSFPLTHNTKSWLWLLWIPMDISVLNGFRSAWRQKWAPLQMMSSEPRTSHVNLTMVFICHGQQQIKYTHNSQSSASGREEGPGGHRPMGKVKWAEAGLPSCLPIRVQWFRPKTCTSCLSSTNYQYAVELDISMKLVSGKKLLVFHHPLTC